MNKSVLLTHLPRFSIFFIEELAKRGVLKLLIIERQDKTYKHSNIILLKKVWRFVLYHTKKFFCAFQNCIIYRKEYNQIKGLNAKKGSIAPNFMVKQLAKKYKFEIVYTYDINNDISVKKKISEGNYDIAMILGGKIIGYELMNSTKAVWINGHGGILPQYRGLNSEYWAIRNHDYDNIGVTVHKATTKLDQGEILFISKVEYRANERFIGLLIRNAWNLVNAYLYVIDNFEEITVKASLPDNSKQKYYKQTQFDVTKYYHKMCSEI